MRGVLFSPNVHSLATVAHPRELSSVRERKAASVNLVLISGKGRSWCVCLCLCVCVSVCVLCVCVFCPCLDLNHALISANRIAGWSL